MGEGDIVATPKLFWFGVDSFLAYLDSFALHCLDKLGGVIRHSLSTKDAVHLLGGTIRKFRQTNA